MQRNQRNGAAMSLALLLIVCGGGGNDAIVAADPLIDVSASASKSSAGMASCMKILPSMLSETFEPVAVENFNSPTPVSL
jgi:hypothetical protein